MNVKDRIRLLCSIKGISVSDFEKKCGMANGYVCSMRKGLGENKLNNVLKAFPNLSRDWLLYGEGEMFNNGAEQEEKSTAYPSKQEETANNAEPGNYIPLIPVNAIGGVLTGVATNGIIRSDCEDVLAPLKSAEAAIAVQGDSMLPRFPSGSRVFIKKIDEERFIDWGNIYVLDTCNGVIIKQISKSVEDGCIRCCSLNPDPLYQPFDVRKEDIYGIYKVLGMLIIQ